MNPNFVTPKEQQMYPLHIRRVQALLFRNFLTHPVFSNRLIILQIAQITIVSIGFQYGLEYFMIF